MKKLLFVAVLASFVAVTAGANSLNVPFFADNGSNMPLTTGSAGWIGLKNTTDQAVTFEVFYAQASGVDRTPNPNSFTVPALNSVSWRPYANDPTEGTGQSVPNMTAGAPKVGGATIVWQGGTSSSLQGRYVENNVDGSTYAYLLPPGIGG